MTKFSDRLSWQNQDAIAKVVMSAQTQRAGHEVSTTTRQAGGFWKGIEADEHKCNGPTRYRVVVLTSWPIVVLTASTQTASHELSRNLTVQAMKPYHGSFEKCGI
jgi:hypothetical protein